ncbi:MAG: cell division protein SepF [Oscillospiraceae bacterium]|nr:cell division protein SepF [Oscillospiraceae bacterium]
MPGILKKFIDMWNGVEDSSAEDEYGSEEVERRREETFSQSSLVQDDSSKGKCINFPQKNFKIFCVKPENYNSEILEIADRLMEGNMIIINMEIENTEPETARRIIDFLRGVVHARVGKFILVSRNTYTITPNNFEITGEGLLPDELGCLNRNGELTR